jgi:hypothetical protein
MKYKQIVIYLTDDELEWLQAIKGNQSWKIFLLGETLEYFKAGKVKKDV